MMPINYSHPGIRQSWALNIFQSWRATRFNSRAAVRLTAEELEEVAGSQPSHEHVKLVRPAKDGVNRVFCVMGVSAFFHQY